MSILCSKKSASFATAVVVAAAAAAATYLLHNVIKQQDKTFVLNENCATKERRKLVREYSVTLKFTVAFAVYELAECGAFIKVEENNFLFCISNYREQLCCFVCKTAHQVNGYTGEMEFFSKRSWNIIFAGECGSKKYLHTLE